jgi:hypothetical protein
VDARQTDYRHTASGALGALDLDPICRMTVDPAASQHSCDCDGRISVSAWPAAGPRCAAGSQVYGRDAVTAKAVVIFVVASAYGYGRLCEWALGGVTSDLLLRPAAHRSPVSH